MGFTALAVGRRQTATAGPNGPAAGTVCTAGTELNIGIIRFKANESNDDMRVWYVIPCSNMLDVTL